MASESLEKKNKNYALRLKRKKYFPAVVIGAEYSRLKSVDKSGIICSNEIVLKLKKKLKELGELYSKVNGNYIGCCAEVKAANNVLIKRPNLNLNQIIFSKPIRPRTMQEIKICKNCKITFK